MLKRKKTIQIKVTPVPVTSLIGRQSWGNVNPCSRVERDKTKHSRQERQKVRAELKSSY